MNFGSYLWVADARGQRMHGIMKPFATPCGVLRGCIYCIRSLPVHPVANACYSLKDINFKPGAWLVYRSGKAIDCFGGQELHFAAELLPAGL